MRWLLGAALWLASCAPVAKAQTSPPGADDRAEQLSPASFELHVFDVGTGLSLLVSGEDFTLLYDAGSNDDRAREQDEDRPSDRHDRRDNRVLAYLDLVLHEPKLDHVFASHPHRDHIGLLGDVLTHYEVASFWDSGLAADTEGYRALMDTLAASSARAHHGGADFRAGEQIPLGRRAEATVLSVRPDAKDPNDASIVLRLDLGGQRILLMGDATGGERADPEQPPAKRSVEAQLLQLPAQQLAAEILVVGHHGSKTSSRGAFLDKVRPKLAIISSGPMPYGRVVLPDQEVLDALQERGAQILRTDDDDEACRSNPAKVGKDADGSPGGCSAFSVRLRDAEPRRIVTRGPLAD